MAVLDEVPGMPVTIEVDGEDLQEYPDCDEANEEPLTTYNYIEAKSGSYFAIIIQFDPAVFPYTYGEYVSVELRLDGRPMGKRWQYSCYQISSGQRHRIEEVRAYPGDRIVIQKFSFSELNIKEDCFDKELVGKLNSLGSITILASRCCYEEVSADTPHAGKEDRGKASARRNRAPSAKKTPSTPSNALLRNGTISEGNLKGEAVSHQTKLIITDEIPHTPIPRPRDQTQKYRYRKTYLDTSTFATFHFKYRSNKSLKDLGVIESLENRLIHGPTRDELIELAMSRGDELIQMRAEAIKMGKEKEKTKRQRPDGANDRGDDSGGVKLMVGSAKKVRKTAQTFDLTDND